MNVILKKPVLTEKSMKLAKSGLYTFLVEKKARKRVIAKAVKELFGVEPVAVKVVNFKDLKRLQRNRRGYFTVSGAKKAVVRLRIGQTIDLFQPEEEKVEVSSVEGEVVAKEKKSMLKGTKVKIEKGEK